MTLKFLAPLATAAALGVSPATMAASTSMTSVTTTYHTAGVDGLRIFYREAGPRDAPAILLLHGFPSSSVMFETLIPRLADRYHLVAPDYPGFGLSDAPPPEQYAYTFDHLASTVDHLAGQLGLTRYSLYLQDYGGPVGMRLALAHPERIQAMIIQNAVSSEAGLGPAWESRKAFWRDRTAHEDQVIGALLSFDATRRRHLGSSPNPERYDPHAWIDEFAHLSRIHTAKAAGGRGRRAGGAHRFRSRLSSLRVLIRRTADQVAGLRLVAGLRDHALASASTAFACSSKSMVLGSKGSPTHWTISAWFSCFGSAIASRNSA